MSAPDEKRSAFADHPALWVSLMVEDENEFFTPQPPASEEQRKREQERAPVRGKRWTAPRSRR